MKNSNQPSTISLETPLKEKDILKLKAGDKVSLTGTIYSARDQAHKKLFDLINQNKLAMLPFDLKGAVIFYVGPSPAKPGEVIGSAGPTTSYRMDPYSPKLMEFGLKAMIGKGERSKAVVDSMKKNKAVYFSATGGIAALLSNCIISAKVIAYEELGAEAIRELKVKNMPLIVAQDSFGNNIFTNYLNYSEI